MADDRRDDLSGELPRDQEQSGRSEGGRQIGGGPGPSDMAAPGGSSGTGGYGEAQNQLFHKGQQGGIPSGQRSSPEMDRGAAFDEQQGGGRGGDLVSPSDDLAEDQAAHQDRGQSLAQSESDRD